MQIRDRTFVISGGSSGLGLATVQELHSQGAYIAILDLNEETGNAIVEDLNKRVLFCKADMSDPTSTKTAVDKVLAWVKTTQKPIGGVVPAAGIGNPGQLIQQKRRNTPSRASRTGPERQHPGCFRLDSPPSPIHNQQRPSGTRRRARSHHHDLVRSGLLMDNPVNSPTLPAKEPFAPLHWFSLEI